MIEESWNCVNNACVDPQDETGIYGSLEECEDGVVLLNLHGFVVI